MYHVELRQFPHNLNRFNLDDRQLAAIVLPWAREQFVELGERKWSPHQARLTILEGPELAISQLSMGRGWRAAQREGVDVTERLLASAREAVAGGAAGGGGAGTAAGEGGGGAGQVGGALADPLALGVQLAALLGDDPAALLAAWRAVVARSAGLAPSESLALAEREVRETGSAGKAG